MVLRGVNLGIGWGMRFPLRVAWHELVFPDQEVCRTSSTWAVGEGLVWKVGAAIFAVSGEGVGG